jgi:ankyrin repeat protein
LLISEGANIECTNAEGATLLLWACENGQTEAAKTLIEGGAVVNYSGGCPPLQKAAFMGYLDICELLLSHGADPNFKDPSGETILLWASEIGRSDVVKVFLNGGADIEYDNNSLTPLQRACFNLHVETAKLLLSKGANIECKHDNGDTLLLWASENSLNITNILLKNGADVDYVNAVGCSPLALACRSGNLEVAHELLKTSKTETKDRNGRTPLHCTVQNKHPMQLEIVRLLYNSGANIDCVDNNGNTPLLLASQEAHIKVVRYLVSRNANIQHRNNDDENCLHLASLDGHLEMVRYLISIGVPFEEKTKEGKTPIDISRELGYHEVAKCLLTNIESARAVEKRAADKAAAELLAVEKRKEKARMTHIESVRAAEKRAAEKKAAAEAEKMERERIVQNESSRVAEKRATERKEEEERIAHQLAQQKVVQQQTQISSANIDAEKHGVDDGRVEQAEAQNSNVLCCVLCNLLGFAYTVVLAVGSALVG